MNGLTPQQEEYIEAQIAAGTYKNAGELLDNAFRLHKDRALALEELQADIQEGLDSGISSKSVHDILEAKKKEYGI